MTTIKEEFFFFKFAKSDNIDQGWHFNKIKNSHISWFWGSAVKI